MGSYHTGTKRTWTKRTEMKCTGTKHTGMYQTSTQLLTMSEPIPGTFTSILLQPPHSTFVNGTLQTKQKIILKKFLRYKLLLVMLYISSHITFGKFKFLRSYQLLLCLKLPRLVNSRHLFRFKTFHAATLSFRANRMRSD